MANPDLDLVKDIPGYKMILKAVLKGQIQQLVQQLSMHTDEESIILTACVGDGTLSHLGSDLGKMFLDNHDDVKSQFVGFCLTNHHSNQPNKENLTSGPGNSSISPKVVSPKLGGAVTRSSPKQRHEPYFLKRPNNRSAKSIERNSRSTEGSMLSRQPENLNTDSVCSIKVEIGNPEVVESLTCAKELSDQSEREEGEIYENQSVYQSEATFQREAEQDYSENSFTSETENSKEVTPESLFVNSCFTSSLPSEKTKRKSRSQSGCDSGIKLEAISESEMEIEITGIKPGNSNVDVNLDHSSDMTLTPKSSGATSSPEEVVKQFPLNLELVSGQLVGEGMSPVRVHICDICRKPFPSKWELGRHRRTHTGEKPYTCEYCNKAFSDKSNMNQHIKGVHFRQPFRKDR